MSLQIEKKNGTTFALTGRLDTVTAPELEKAMAELLPRRTAWCWTWGAWSISLRQDSG